MYFEIVPDPDGYRARILDGNQEIMFVSEMIFKSKADAKSAIALVSNAAATAVLRDST